MRSRAQQDVPEGRGRAQAASPAPLVQGSNQEVLPSPRQAPVGEYKYDWTWPKNR